MKALADIVNDENWCIGYLALDDLGCPVPTESPHAVKRCMLGWLQAKYGTNQNLKSISAINRVNQICIKRYGSQITTANDNFIKDAAEVAAIFAEARV